MDKLNKKWYGQNRSSLSSYYGLAKLQFWYKDEANLATYRYNNTSLNNSAACSNNPIIPPSEKRRLVHIPSSSCYVMAVTIVTHKHSSLTGDKSSSDIALSSSTLGDILCRGVVMDHVITTSGEHPPQKLHSPQGDTICSQAGRGTRRPTLQHGPGTLQPQESSASVVSCDVT